MGYGAGAQRFWGSTFDPSGLYRFNAATGALLNVYPFTSAFGTVQFYPSHLLPVAADSSLVVGGSRPNSTNQVGPIYVARLRVSGLLR